MKKISLGFIFLSILFCSTLLIGCNKNNQKDIVFDSIFAVSENDVYAEKELLIVKNIIRLAKELGINVISEGIETKSQSIGMKKLHCDYAQGYYYSKPLPMEEAVDFFKQNID